MLKYVLSNKHVFSSCSLSTYKLMIQCSKEIFPYKTYINKLTLNKKNYSIFGHFQLKINHNYENAKKNPYVK